jgi:hypothetical protein
LIEIDAKMQINNQWKIRHNNLVIMDEVISSSDTLKEIKTFSNWRIFVKVNCLSEICNTEGTRMAN